MNVELDIQTKNVWGEKASEFLDIVDNRNNGDGISVREKVLYPKIADHIDDISGKIFLDAGCGEGTVGRIALGKGAKGAYVVGCDIVPQFLQAANIRSNGQEHVVLANLRDGLPFATNSFDIVCYNLVLMWIPDVITVAKETARITKPDGKLVVSLLHPWTALSRVDEIDPENPALILQHGIQNGTFMRKINKTAGPFPYYQRSIAEYIDTFTREKFYLNPMNGFDEVFAPRESDVSLSKKLFPEFLILVFIKGNH